MKNKHTRVLFITLGGIIILLLTAYFGINLWLQYQLPNYIKNNSNYNVSYEDLNVDFSSGDIVATDFSINTKNLKDDIIGVDGTVDSIKISRLGLYDAIFNNKISSSNLLLVKPQLKVVLAKPGKEKSNKKQNPVTFKNINIKEGNITIFRHTKQKYLAVNQLSLMVSDLKLTEKDVKDKLPVVFDEYTISGQNFFFRPDNVYVFKAQEITTDKQQMYIKDFQMIPLLTYKQFIKYYPKKRNLFDVEAKLLEFKDIKLKNNKITLSSVKFFQPNIKISTTNAKPQEKEKSFTYDVRMKDVNIENGKLEILKPNSTRLFSVNRFNLSITEMRVDEQTAKGNIPFAYEKFLISGRELNYITSNQNIWVKSIAVNPNTVESHGIAIKSTNHDPRQTSMDLTLNHINAKVNHWKLENSKLKMDVDRIALDGLNGSLTPAKNKKNKKPSISGIDYPLTVKTVSIKNSNVGVNQDYGGLSFKNLFATFNNVRITEESSKRKLPVEVGSYQLSSKNFKYQTEFYTLGAGSIKLNQNQFQLTTFNVKPKYSRSQFTRLIPKERDLYDITVKGISGSGNWNLFTGKQAVNIAQINIIGADANIFRSKVPKDDESIKPMYSELLRKIKFPLIVNNLNLKNSRLVYEEDTEKSDGPGKLVFENFNMNVKNLNSGKGVKNTLIPIVIDCSFMNASPMHINWHLNTASMDDTFTISGNISDLAAPNINKFIEPYLKIRATGSINNLAFDFKGNKRGIGGKFNLKYKNLKVEILTKNKEKNVILSAIANLIVKTDSGTYPESVIVEHVERDPTKSFFNLFWKGVESGLKKSLIGEGAVEAEKKIKETVSDAKAIIDDNEGVINNVVSTVKDAATDIKNTVQDVKDNIKAEDATEKKRKTCFFKRIFKRKNKAKD